MSTDPTDPAPGTALAVQDSDVRHSPAARDAYMHAMAAAEDVLGRLQGGMPTAVTISQDVVCGTEVRVYCGGEPSLVLELAASYDVPIDRVPNPEREGTTYVEIRPTVRGVPVHAWTLCQNDPTDEDEPSAAEDPCRPCGCPKRFDRHADGCPTRECPSCAAPSDETGSRIPEHQAGCPREVTP